MIMTTTVAGIYWLSFLQQGLASCPIYWGGELLSLISLGRKLRHRGFLVSGRTRIQTQGSYWSPGWRAQRRMWFVDMVHQERFLRAGAPSVGPKGEEVSRWVTWGGVCLGWVKLRWVFLVEGEGEWGWNQRGSAGLLWEGLGCWTRMLCLPLRGFWMACEHNLFPSTAEGISESRLQSLVKQGPVQKVL